MPLSEVYKIGFVYNKRLFINMLLIIKVEVNSVDLHLLYLLRGHGKYVALGIRVISGVLLSLCAHFSVVFIFDIDYLSIKYGADFHFNVDFSEG
jgi:hypothetical protein